MTVAAELRRILDERGETPYRLGPRMGTHRSHVHRWLTGVYLPDLYNLAKLAEALDLSDEAIAGIVRMSRASVEGGHITGYRGRSRRERV
jgi:transcriptional regulator with XRE-family HTH domain